MVCMARILLEKTGMADVKEKIEELKSTLKGEATEEHIESSLGKDKQVKSLGDNTLSLVEKADIEPKKKLDYIKQMIPLIRTEDHLFKVSELILKSSLKHPEAHQEMFSTLKKFAREYPKITYDNGAALSGVCDRLFVENQLDNGALKDTPNFAENYLDIIKNDMQSDRHKEGRMTGLEEDYRHLDNVVAAYPASVSQVYDTYLAVKAVDKSKYNHMTNMAEISLCRKMVQQLGKDAKDADKVQKLNDRIAKIQSPQLKTSSHQYG